MSHFCIRHDICCCLISFVQPTKHAYYEFGFRIARIDPKKQLALLDIFVCVRVPDFTSHFILHVFAFIIR